MSISDTRVKTKKHKLAMALCSLVCTGFLLGFLKPAAAGEAWPTRYQNKWIVVVGSDRTVEGAWRVKLEKELEAEIILSTYFAKLDPGWFLLVAGSYQSKAEAQGASKKLKRKNIDSDYRFTGTLHNFAKDKYRIGKLTEESLQALRSACFIQTGEESPDKERSISFQPQDPTSDALLVQRGQEEFLVKDLFFQTQQLFWSKDSKKIAFGDEDLYAGSGNRALVIVDLEKLEVVKVDTTSLAGGQAVGKREMFELAGLCWLSSSDQVLFKLSLDFMGSSGHPGIDLERKSRLGPDFDRKEPLVLGQFAVYLTPAEVDLEKKPEHLQVLNPDKFGYIDTKGEMVIKPRFDEAAEFHHGLAKVRIADSYSYIDRKGSVVANPQPKEVSVVSEDLNPVQIGDQFGYQDQSGMIVIDPLYDSAGRFRQGLAAVRIGDKFGYINPKGELVLGLQWDQASAFAEGLARVKLAGKFGYIDQTGKLVIETRFEAAGDFSQGLAPVKIGGS